ncbi:MAG: hypothetical protein QOI55_624 [Actinomycetota bacterium]|nr:hypothetical protein [Actinomycetota bacterium]
MPAPVEPCVYTWPQSVAPGGVVAVHASGTPTTAELEIARVGAHREVVTRTPIQLQLHDIPDDANTAGCDWPVTATVATEAAWPSGYYEVVVRTRVANSTHEAVGFFVVRPALGTGNPERPLLVLSTNTWNAYNDFGGSNTYTGATHASFARPFARGYLRKPLGPGSRVTVVDAPDHEMRAHVRYLREHQFSGWAGSAGWPNYELPFVRWAEEAGYALDYATNADLDLVSGLLDGRRVYLSVGHDEYWSAPMRDAVEGFVRDGGHALFLSGNTSYWQVRLDDAGRTMVAYKQQFEHDPVYGTADERFTTSIWSDRLCDRPENAMTGVSFVRGGYHRIGRAVGAGAGGYTVYRAEHWIFAGTDVSYGDLIGAASVVVGYECDGCDFTMRDGLPIPTGSDGTPPDFEILGLAPAEPFDRHNAARPVAAGARSEIEYNAWRALGDESPAAVARLRHGHAVMGVHQPGGTVFTSGCTDWAWGLANADPAIDRMTRNLLDRLLERQPGA